MEQSSTIKYAEAVSLYAETRLSIKEICEQTQIPFKAFSSYLSRHHRDLILKRHNLQGLKKVKLRGTKGQTTASRLKYRDAIAAADSIEYIEYNISQIARIFGLSGTGLGNQLRHHYPDIMPRREKERRRLGIADNIHHGVRPWCEESYASAVELLRTSDITVDEAARQCDVTLTGLREHIACYHKGLVKLREKKRLHAQKKERINVKEWFKSHGGGKIDEEYMPKVELSRPVIQGEIRPGRFEIIDGNHRMEKARQEGAEYVDSYKLMGHQLSQYLCDEKGYKAYIEYWNDKLQG